MCQQGGTASSSSNTRSDPTRRRWSVSFLAAAVGLVAAYSYQHPHSFVVIVALDFVQALGGSLLGHTPKDESVFEYDDDGLPLCHGCHCTPGWDQDPNDFVCPNKKKLPPYVYPSETIEALASQTIRNPFSLDCDPYTNATCDTVPSLERNSWGRDAVCGIQYDDVSEKQPQETTNSTSCPLTTYTIQTYESPLVAAQEGATVSHIGPCGVCSTTQDLAAYMSHPDMVAKGRRCCNRVLVSHAWGVSCYENLGFSNACATIWAHNSYNTAMQCMDVCVQHLFSPANGPEPECRLNDCLHCDEVQSGPNFQLFAGRTRRNSGLRTPILRQCDGLANLVHDGCPPKALAAASLEEGTL